MVVNLNKPFIDMDGNPVEDHTMQRLCRVVLLQNREESADDKLKAYDLSKKLAEPECDLNAEEIVYLKSKLAVVTPLEYGQLCEELAV